MEKKLLEKNTFEDVIIVTGRPPFIREKSMNIFKKRDKVMKLCTIIHDALRWNKCHHHNECPLSLFIKKSLNKRIIENTKLVNLSIFLTPYLHLTKQSYQIPERTLHRKSGYLISTNFHYYFMIQFGWICLSVYLAVVYVPVFISCSQYLFVLGCLDYVHFKLWGAHLQVFISFLTDYSARLIMKH